MEENPPLFLQNSRCITHHHGFVFSSSFLIFLNRWFVFFATVTFGLVLFYYHPPILSFLTNILPPNHIINGWDYLIPLLVLFAIICAFLNQNNNSSDDDPKSNQESTSSIHPQIPKWLDQYTERRIYNESYQIVVEETISSDHKMVGRLRSSISYPDMRQEERISTSDRWQFSDDIDLNNTRRQRSDHHRRSRHHRRREEEGHEGATIDKFLVHTRVDGSSAHPPPPEPSPVVKKEVGRTLQKVGKEDGELKKEKEKQQLPAPTLPPPVTEKKVDRALQKVGKEYRESDKEKENQQPPALNSPPPPPPPLNSPPPPPPPPPCRHVSKKSSGAKDIANALADFYNKKKNSFNHALCSPSSSHPAAPPPPPPQHSSSVFYNLFKKSSKSKRIHSFTQPPPPPPPPPPKKKIKPSPSAASTNVYEKEDDLRRGSESPLIWMPPPPWSPPIAEKKLKFEVRSDHVGVSSGLSDCLDTENAGMSMIYGGDESVGLSPSGYCSSPDVNSKADKFIARFHESLRRENVNFIKEKERTRLGGAVTM